MNGLRLAILGSCVTSSILRVAPVGTLVSYHARTSLVSLMSPPLPLADGQLTPRSNFAASMIKADFEKTFFEDLEARRCDCLIVDFVDERWDLLRAGNAWVTQSQDFVEAGGDDLAQYRLERVPRLDPRTHELWRDACSRFAVTFRRRFPDVKVVLHTATGVAGYRDGAKVLPLRQVCDGLEVGSLNRMLEEYSALFRAELGSAEEIRLPRGEYLADSKHIWGLSPFHYENRYYGDAATELCAILGAKPASASRSRVRGARSGRPHRVSPPARPHGSGIEPGG